MPNAVEGEEELYEDVIVEPRQKPLVWVVYLLLFAFTIPWYWPTGYIGPSVIGFPLWVATSLGGVVMLALWTVFTINRFWRHASEGDEV